MKLLLLKVLEVNKLRYFIITFAAFTRDRQFRQQPLQAEWENLVQKISITIERISLR